MQGGHVILDEVQIEDVTKETKTSDKGENNSNIIQF